MKFEKVAYFQRPKSTIQNTTTYHQKTTNSPQFSITKNTMESKTPCKTRVPPSVIFFKKEQLIPADSCPIKQQGAAYWPRKLYYFSDTSNLESLNMKPSPAPRFKVLNLLKKAFALSAILLLVPHLRALTVAEQYLFAAANQARASEGLPPLRFDPVLSEAAAQHAREMALHAAISHQFNDEADLAERGASAGVHFRLISENVAEAPTSVTIHELWMNSPHHRANLLDPKIDSIGVAIVRRGDQLYAVEDFASTVQTLSLIQQERTVASVLSQTGLHVAATTEDARQTCAMSTGYAGSRQPWFVMRYTASSLDQIPSQLKNRLSTGKYHQAVVGACEAPHGTPFTAYNIAVLLYP